jgi:hypothetical protein
MFVLVLVWSDTSVALVTDNSLQECSELAESRCQNEARRSIGSPEREAPIHHDLQQDVIRTYEQEPRALNPPEHYVDTPVPCPLR